LFTIAFDVFAGATTIGQATASNPGTPASAIVGISGEAGHTEMVQVASSMIDKIR
jgi:hypothetical protein